MKVRETWSGVVVEHELEHVAALSALEFEAYEAARSIPTGDHWR